MSDQALFTGSVASPTATLLLDRRRRPASNDVRLYGGSAGEILNTRRRNDGPRLIVTPNLDHWRLLARSRALRSAYNAAAIVLNDSRFLTKAVFGRGTMTLPGCELVLMMLAAAKPRARIMVIGCPPEVKAFLQGKRPDLSFDCLEPSMGFVFKRAERRAIAERAAANRPDRIFVCVGAPQSEVLAYQLQRRLDHDCDILCCGAGLQFAAGVKVRAPRWMQTAGLEWAWRMAREPHTRLRYLLDAAFLAANAGALARLRQGRRAAIETYTLTRPPELAA